MLDAKFTETVTNVQHVKVVLDLSYEDARSSFEMILPPFKSEALVMLGSGNIERAGQLLAQGPELSILLSRDHGSVLKIHDLDRKAIQYDVGNPLTASKMTKHQSPAALYAPFRVVLYENADGHAVFEYDKPSSLFGQFGDEAVTEIALSLDAAIKSAIQRVGK